MDLNLLHMQYKVVLHDFLVILCVLSMPSIYSLLQNQNNSVYLSKKILLPLLQSP